MEEQLNTNYLKEVMEMLKDQLIVMENKKHWKLLIDV